MIVAVEIEAATAGIVPVVIIAAREVADRLAAVVAAVVAAVIMVVSIVVRELPGDGGLRQDGGGEDGGDEIHGGVLEGLLGGFLGAV